LPRIRARALGAVSPALAALFSIAACTGDAPPPARPLGETCDERPDAHCEHPLDRVLVPMLRGVGLEPREAALEVQCRRLFVDLLGRIPSERELDVCTERPAADTALALLDDPEHLDHELRAWSEILRYDVGQSHHRQIRELDALVARMVRGEIRYDEFAIEAIYHPGFFAPRLGVEWGADLFSIFLGRPARADEMAGMVPLGRAFSARFACDGQLEEAGYELCIASGLPEEECVRLYRESCVFARFEGTINFCGCTPITGGGCISDVLGPSLDLGFEGCNFETFTDAFRVTEWSVGQGVGDTTLGVDETGAVVYRVPVEPLPPIDPAMRARLRRIGEALVARGDFWDAAVDRELRRYVGWWHVGFRKPDFDVPAIRALLAGVLRDTGSLREVQRLIVTSLLYTAPADAPDAALLASAGAAGEPPPWTMGPLKVLSAEQWLSSLERAVGERTGACDHRFLAPEEGTGAFTRYATGEALEVSSTLDPMLFEPTFSGLYETFARRIGGCVPAARPRAPSVSLASAQADIATQLCGAGREVPPAFVSPEETDDASLDTIATHLSLRLLSHRPDDDERVILRSAARDCLDDGACADAHDAARFLCRHLAESTAFTIY
jgi:hypothetical protein